MYPEDRVLIGVVKTKRDLAFAADAHWYRIPQAQMPRGIHAEYIALFLSGRVFKEQSGSVAYYARRRGLELVRRRDLMPTQPDHKRADQVYYKVSLGQLFPKQPPVLNPTHRSITFIHTTWDRFVNARQIGDLYSDADYFVDRIYHALRSPGIRLERFWETETRETGLGAGVRVLCQRGTVTAATTRQGSDVYLDINAPEDRLLAQIRERIAQHDGPVMVSVPLEE